MSVQLFEGPAGSGKTTRLFAAVAERLTAHPLAADQRVLALTKMHGSRRRMSGKLSEVLGAGAKSECSTLNSFTYALVHRWKSLARTIRDPLPIETDFAGIADVAAQLVGHRFVINWVAARHPLLVVDELQDLRGSELGVIKELSSRIHVLCAADEYQELDPAGPCEGVEWARAVGTVVPLVQVHRTNVQGLLDAAGAIRTGAAVPLEGPGLSIIGVPTAALAAWKTGAAIAKATGPIAVISTAGPQVAPFVKETIAKVGTVRFSWRRGGSVTFGPYKVEWEADHRNEVSVSVGMLGLDQPNRVVSADEIIAHRANVPGELVAWVEHRRRLMGECTFSAERIRAELERAHALRRGHGTVRGWRRTGLTIHGAKNREFDHVVVLWPFQVTNDRERSRRLLYNAITRAKRDCIVLVQDPVPKQSRLRNAPFR
ncbi:MAG: ATP-dependent helicase [Verrucomicrobiales bacterium]|nr:ATP-dependent helicase [Verrucomicrobiales bacterium]